MTPPPAIPTGNPLQGLVPYEIAYIPAGGLASAQIGGIATGMHVF